MKKTYNINISGLPFVIDEDAYNILDTYLTTLGEACSRSGETETATDIEQRIAEIFAEKRCTGREILSREDVTEVIERMGRPEEIIMESTVEEEAAGTAETPPPYNNIQSPPLPVKKRLYRDIDNKILGGVCSGLGWYLSIDPVWVRVITVGLAFLSGSTLALIYIILWIIIPAARTPFQRMQMMGIDPSVSNVGKVVTGEYNREESMEAHCRETDAAREFGSGAGNVLLIIMAAIGVIIVGALLLALSLAFIAALFALCIVPVTGYHHDDAANVLLILGCVCGGALVVGIPCFFLFRNLIEALTHRHSAHLNSAQKSVFLIFWLLGVAAVITCALLL